MNILYINGVPYFLGHGGDSEGKKTDYLSLPNKTDVPLQERFIDPFNTAKDFCPGLKDLAQVFVVVSCRGEEVNAAETNEDDSPDSDQAKGVGTLATKTTKVAYPTVVDR